MPGSDGALLDFLGGRDVLDFRSWLDVELVFEL
jgi:hypothetical protein